MQIENENNIKMSFPELPVRRGLGNLPLSESLIKEEKCPCLMKQVEDPRTLRAAKHSGMTDFCYNGNDEIPYKSRDDSKWHNGFTLIELLVVVLIIGILSAVALPQYQKAVEKSKVTQLFALLKPIAEAEERYHMANGSYTYMIEDLDVGMPANAQWIYSYNFKLPNGAEINLGMFSEKFFGQTEHVRIEFFGNFSTVNLSYAKPGMVTCVARNDDKLGVSICKSMSISTLTNVGCGGGWEGSCTRYLIRP